MRAEGVGGTNLLTPARWSKRTWECGRSLKKKKNSTKIPLKVHRTDLAEPLFGNVGVGGGQKRQSGGSRKTPAYEDAVSLLPSPCTL